jgi:hypothetical protein
VFCDLAKHHKNASILLASYRCSVSTSSLRFQIARRAWYVKTSEPLANLLSRSIDMEHSQKGSVRRMGKVFRGGIYTLDRNTPMPERQLHPIVSAHSSSAPCGEHR